MGCLEIGRPLDGTKDGLVLNGAFDKCLELSAFPIKQNNDFHLVLDLIHKDKVFADYVFGKPFDSIGNELAGHKTYYSPEWDSRCVSDCGFAVEDYFSEVIVFFAGELIDGLVFTVSDVDDLYSFYHSYFASDEGLDIVFVSERDYFGYYVVEWISKKKDIVLRLELTGRRGELGRLRVFHLSSTSRGVVSRERFTCIELVQSYLTVFSPYSTARCPSSGVKI